MNSKKIFLLVLVAIGLSACSKEEVSPEAQPNKQEAFALNFEGDVASMPVVDFAEKSELRAYGTYSPCVRLFGDQENARAVKIKLQTYDDVINKGEEPELNNKLIFKVLGQRGDMQAILKSTKTRPWGIPCKIDADQNFIDTRGKVARTGFAITEHDGIQRVSIRYFSLDYWQDYWKPNPRDKEWTGVFREGQYGYMTIGGAQDRRSWTNNGEARESVMVECRNPNEKLVQTAIGEFTTRDIILTSPLKKVTVYKDANNGVTAAGEKYNTATLRTHFMPRGCIFAFKIHNTTGHKIKVHSLAIMNTATYPSPFYVSGRFDDEDVKYDNKEKFTKEEYRLPFVGYDDAGTFSLYASKTATEKGITLDDNTTTTGRFFLWGFPKPKEDVKVVPVNEKGLPVKEDGTIDTKMILKLNNDKPLVVKVNYSFYGSDDQLQNGTILSMGQKFNAPTLSNKKTKTEGWQDGSCYRAVLQIKKRNSTDGPMPIVEFLELKSNPIDSYDDQGVIEGTIVDRN